MSGLLFFVLIVLLARGLMNSIKAGQLNDRGVRLPEYNLLVQLAAGGAIIAAFIMGMMGKWGGALAALILSVLVSIGYILQAVKELPMLKKAGFDRADLMKFQPWWIWGRIVLLGMGKWMTALFYCTIVGIPLLNSIKTASRNLDDLTEQIQLRREYERAVGKR